MDGSFVGCRCCLCWRWICEVVVVGAREEFDIYYLFDKNVNERMR